MTIIHVTSGDIIESTAQTIACPVNLRGVMGCGLARTMAETYPGLLKQYRLDCLLKDLTLDHPTVIDVSATKKVLCVATKDDWRRPSKLEWIAGNLLYIAEYYDVLGITSLALPRLGCGAGGLQWSDVRPLIHRYLSDVPIDITIYGA